MEAHVIHPISDPSDPGDVRRAAVLLASRLGFGPADAGRVALVATEAASNIVKHAGKGHILMRTVADLADRPGIELLALDRGPGMADVQRCMEDGYSTAGSPGTGLGALSRLASRFDIYSRLGQGAALMVHVFPETAKPRGVDGFVLGGVRVAMPGETVCGDDWAWTSHEGRFRFLVADGLGHGVRAAEAAAEAVRQFEAHQADALPEVFAAMHGALLATRGAAVSIAELTSGSGELSFAGIGNVAGFLAWPGGSRHMITRNGTVGGQPAQARPLPYPWPPGALLVMHSDGLNSHSSLDGYPGLLAHHPSLVAAVLYRDFSRGTDDATVLVVAHREQSP